MCQFISWIVKGKEVYFLTTADIESKKGKELRDYCQNDDDLRGHGAIRHFYKITGGKEFEREDFSSPKGFPAQIISAIKKGKFGRWFGPVPQDILRAPLDADFQAKRDALYADFIRRNATRSMRTFQAKRDALDADAWMLVTKTKNRSDAWR